MRFTWDGKRHTVTLNHKPTSPNIKMVERQMVQVQREIAAGAFDFEKHFPSSPDHLAKSKFFHYADLYLQTLTGAENTRVSYGSGIRLWKRLIGDKPLRDIKPSDISVAIVAAQDRRAASSVNMYIAALRGVFDLARADKVIDHNPMVEIDNLSAQAPAPDPLEMKEVEAVLAHLARNDHIHAFYEFALMTGLRPSEQIALRWGKVDWAAKTIRIDTGFVRGKDKATKTSRVRDIDLNDRAVAALNRMRPHTWLLGLNGHVFVNPRNGLPWRWNEELRVKHWLPALKACGIRMRDAYQTRHTYATLLLMGGINVAYIAKQLGHSNVAMTLKHYAKWVDSADRGRQAKLANEVFGHSSPTAAPKTLK